MIFTAHADAHRVRIAHQRKDVAPRRSGEAVGIRNGLQADRGKGKDQVEVAAGDFLGDRVAGADISLGVVLAENHPAAIDISALFQRRQGAGQSLIERGNRYLLHHRNFQRALGASGGTHSAGIQIGVQQDGSRHNNHRQSEGDSLQDCSHL